MKILKTKNDLKKAILNTKNLGFVPTMGSLHEGHISLIKKSKKNSEKTLVSIYINPTQFNKKNDFKSYPRNINKERDSNCAARDRASGDHDQSRSTFCVKARPA